ncbi:hypothetical protein NCCP1664_11660 [Zafaria cholistanensis]|uniref:GP-PDE domain-containing protein n=1 Tax=Zafaria cholistanensis TaxID=1682741 RepID=A0A5A7NPP9_9MICC|nr:glycerophosphodiester phosphodiesterase [Zafaria cholistanensis]GER22669.1 hypothetical protein NCCP1664_11660 [Zafaria cholistanensis]
MTPGQSAGGPPARLLTDRPSRRQLLAVAASGLVLSGCGGGAGGSGGPAEGPEPVHTLDRLLATRPFHIAHRGSHDNWPEHTAEAYRQSAAHGAAAIEVSVQATADGVLVCHHDPDLLRMTGVARQIAHLGHRQLEGVLNNARPWLGPGSAQLPIPDLKSVLDAHAGNRVVFIEDKQGTNTQALLDLMDSYPDARQHFVWKQPAGSNRYRLAAERGYRTWGYFTGEDFGRLDELGERFDLLGLHHSAGDEVVARFVATGKPVICWEVHTRWLRDRLLRLGVAGMMTSNYPYVSTDAPSATADRFVTGLRGAGDLPWALAWSHQPPIRPETSSIRLDHREKASYCMGSLCPVTAGSYTLGFELRWPEGGPGAGQHAGIAFGQETDLPYRVREPGAGSGYHVVVREDGLLELLGRVANTVSAYSLASVPTPPPVPGTWLRLSIDVTPEQITVSRLPGSEAAGSDPAGAAAGASVSVRDSTYRGGYFSLCRNYDGGPPVEFRSIHVRA